MANNHGGSFLKQMKIRTLRLELQKGNVDKTYYRTNISEHIKQAIKEQEILDIDVLVHGEAERNDMVEYFVSTLMAMYLPKMVG